MRSTQPNHASEPAARPPPPGTNRTTHKNAGALASNRIQQTTVRTCASRRLGTAAWAAVPAVAGPGAADEPAADDGGVDQREPELHHDLAALSAPAQLAVLVAPGVGALHRPASARLDRGGHPACGDLADQAALSQRLPAGLVVVSRVQVHNRPVGEPADHVQRV